MSETLLYPITIEKSCYRVIIIAMEFKLAPQAKRELERRHRVERDGRVREAILAFFDSLKQAYPQAPTIYFINS